MSWSVLARKDVSDAGRSRTIWLLAILLSVLSVGYAFGHSYLGASEFPAFLSGLSDVVATVLPILALLLGYKSIADDRTSGSLFLTLSFPHSRRDLLAGTFVGRTVVLLAPTLVALVAAGVVGAVRYGTEGVAMYPWFLFVTALYAVAFLGVAVGLSMSTTADRRITFAAFGVYMLAVNLWGSVHSLVMLVLHRFDFTVLRNMPDWALLFRLIGPSESYGRLVRAGFDVEQASRYVTDTAPFYVDWWMAVVVLLAWTLVPLALGYGRFRNADL
ncbi:ABC transporter permease [Halosimplex salinum]|uniref:ABC transporter permease n=1 Tax=Halosimplex salinum TaxID=1710538 RepID=UPI000F49768A|nr:ABC transporter permease subunit [Halosimplex salinum]